MPPLEELIPVRELELMTTLELGSVTRLIRHAWLHEEPPCTVPAGSSFLARLARLSPEEYSRVQGTVERLFEPFGERRIHAASANAIRRLSTVASRRSEASRTANRARWSSQDSVAPDHPGPGGNGPRGRGADPPNPQPTLRMVSAPDPNRIRFGSDSDRRTPLRSAVLNPSFESAPALPRRAETAQIKTAPEDLDPVRSAQTARALIQEGEELKRWRDVVTILKAAHFPWAEQHKRILPADLCERIADHPHVLPILAAYVIESVNDIGVGRTRNGQGTVNPIGMVIARTGTESVKAGRRARPAVDVPLWFLRKWERDVDYVKRCDKSIEAIKALREAQRVAGTGGATQAAGGS